MYVLRRPEGHLVYLANPRTGSRATARALEGLGFVMLGSHHSGFESPETPVGPVASIATTVRDEEETLESWCRKLDCTMTELLLGKLGVQRAIIAGWDEGLFPHEPYAETVLAYEDLENELNDWLARFDFGPVELEWVDD